MYCKYEYSIDTFIFFAKTTGAWTIFNCVISAGIILWITQDGLGNHGAVGTDILTRWI